MDIDLEQFHRIFFEESLENLDSMETHLMDLQPGSEDAEFIDDIFRSAHSIKGGSATLGFTYISDFTHDLETLLDHVRMGARSISIADIDLLLQSVDCLRDIFSALVDGEEPKAEETCRLKGLFQCALSEDNGDVDAESDGIATQTDKVESNNVEAPNGKGWIIHFSPNIDILQSGNEPLRLFRELDELGELHVKAHLDELPQIHHCDAKECHMKWSLRLITDADKEVIDDIFEWVADDSAIEICSITEDKAVKPEQPDAEHIEDMRLMESSATSTNTSYSTQSRTKADVNPISLANNGTEAEIAKTVVSNKLQTATTPSQTQAEIISNKSKSDVSIRVSISKIDQLINMVGELVITQSMLSQISKDFSMADLQKLKKGLSELEHHTRQMQDRVMQIRMLPINYSFSRFPRTVRDLSKRLGKKINLLIKGEQTELDKTVMEKIGDPMVHLVRNAIDHGIEMPDQRLKLGKPEYGTITLNAYHLGGNVVIEISDDGAGLNKLKIIDKAISRGLIESTEDVSNEQIYAMIFEPGFSTVDTISDVSGRGVGMDVVRSNIQALNGHINVKSKEGEGSIFTIRLPLTLAIVDGQLLRVGGNTYILPLVSIVESMQVNKTMVNQVAGGGQVFHWRDEYIPIIHLSEAFGIHADYSSVTDGILIVVDCEHEKIGLLVDELLDQQQVVVKSLETNYRAVDGVSSATILGDGTVALILDILGIVKILHMKKAKIDTHITNLLGMHNRLDSNLMI